jgi:CheY-like chemotaxis protein
MPHALSRHAVRPVLIVDDVVSEAMTFDLLCRSLGVETICTTSAAEAAAILARIRPAAMITDLGMPCSGALDCLFMIAEHAPAIPVMVVNGSGQSLLEGAVELVKAYGLGDLVCVAKPVDIKTLRAFVARAGLVCKPSQWDLH